jgi:uncharacterized protein YhaN
VRIARLEAWVYGALTEQTFDLDASIAVIYGKNEAGKSTFLSALETIFYGFDPATRDDHPLVQWARGVQGVDGVPDLWLEAHVTLEGGPKLRVERVLQGRGKLRIAAGDDEFEGARESNLPLPAIAGLPRPLYRSVYGLGTDALVELEGDVRTHVDELLLGEGAVPGMRTTHEVRHELAEEARKLWRSDNRGKPRAAELKARVRDARHDLRTARAAEDELRSAREERANLDAELIDLRAAKDALEHQQADAGFLKEIYELRLRKASNPVPALDALGGDALADPEKLQDEVRAAQEQIAIPRARLEREARTLTSQEQRFLEHAETIETRNAERGRFEADLDALDSAQRRERSSKAQAFAALERIQGRKAGSDDLDRVATFPLEALRAAHEDWSLAQENAPAADETAHERPAWLFIAAALGAVVIVASPFSSAPPWTPIIGVALLGLALFAALRSTAPAPQEEPADPRSGDVVRVLATLGADPVFASSPSALLRLIDRLEQLSDLIKVWQEEKEEARLLAVRIDEREDRWSALAEELGVDDEGSGPAILARLDEALRAARASEAEVRADQTERQKAETAVQALTPQLEERSERLARLEQALLSNAGEAADVSSAFHEIQERIEEDTYLRKQETRLRADPRWKKLSRDPRLELDDPSLAPWHESSLRHHRHELEFIENELVDKAHRRGELTSELRADPGNGIARAGEALDLLEGELRSVRRAHDRLALLGRILAVADSEFREEHQPDVLRRASHYLEAVTLGRYTRLEYSHGTEAGLYVIGAGQAEPVKVDQPLSRGTCDQIYLCLRLGLLDHLDESRESLPLVLDESLVHWDADRRAKLYPVLRAVAERRQVLLLTCHQHLAHEWEEALGVKRLELAGTPAAEAAPRGQLS